MTIVERLADVFDRGLSDGVESLSASDRELFLIQNFIIDYEMGGLSSYVYNRLPKTETITAAIHAMSSRGLIDLSRLLNEAVSIFDGYVDPDPPTTWQEVCRQYDPMGKLDDIDRRIGQLDNYGLEGASIAEG